MDERLNLRRFGPFTLDLESDLLLRGGERVPLQPQAMTVLRILAARAGELVTRQELQRAVWGEGTFVDFNQGLNWCIKRIREVLGDDAENPRFIETVPRKGYRFIAPLDVPRAPRWRWLAAVAVLAVVCLGVMHRQAPVTVVILPFDNFTGDPRNELAASAATEDVINRVGSADPSRLKVIDRLTAAKFKRTNECIIHIGRELGADFVMEGSLLQGRTTAALYRVADNTQVWAAAVEPRAGAAAISAKVAATFLR
ncbi:MAG TPA: winged helix-turn-helix domain-containing protein [Thermoanaerobaculia bacterium]|nr:winged helix-turn-helix domain-containing protein [Thermoanaerobaculia bacterium]